MPNRLRLVANTGTREPATVSGALPFFVQDVDVAELSALFMVLRIARAAAQYVTESGFVERPTFTVPVSSTSAELWRDVWREIDAWRGARTTLGAVHTRLIAADDRTGNDLANAACELVVFETPCTTLDSGGVALAQFDRHLYG